MSVSPVSTYAEFIASRPLKARLRQTLRDLAVEALGRGRSIKGGGWVRFPYYHHVYDDERHGFERQLDELRGAGEFLGLDDAVALLESGRSIDGRYFCLTFDDGLAGCRHAIEILAARGIPAAFYLTTALMGRVMAPDDSIARGRFGYGGRRQGLAFLGWDECRAALGAGMSFGSHTTGHLALAGLDEADALGELTASKAAIEAELGVACRHFCAPFGLPGRHYRPERDPVLARQAGYASFATGIRGPNPAGADVFALRRDHMLAGWGTGQLRYFMSHP